MKTDKFWKDKKVLILGHTGFKGAWLCILLKQFQSNIFGIALPPENQSLFNKANVNALCEKSIFLDINNEQKIAEIIQEINLEITTETTGIMLLLAILKECGSTIAPSIKRTMVLSI